MVLKYTRFGSSSGLDIGSARAAERNPNVLGGLVLAYDNFESGFGRWADHIASNDVLSTPRNPMSLTSERALTGSRSLLMAARSNPPGIPTSTWRHRTCGTYNRLSRDFPITETAAGGGFRYLDFSMLLACGGTSARALKTMIWFVDTQAWVLPADWESSSSSTYKGRSYFMLCSRMDDVTGYHSWYLGNGTTNPDAGSNVLLTGSETGHGLPGFNEDKRNATYLRWTVDLWANGGLGKNVEVQFADKTVNVEGLNIKPLNEDPQYITSDAQRSFAGGMNPGVSVVAGDPDTAGQEQGEAWIIMDETVVSIRKAA